MRYLSVCSGIEAATVAWAPLGWQAVAFSEIDKFPSAVLAQHYPTVPNYGDLTRFQEWPDAAVDLLVGGTPCQSFSVAGLRKGMADPRGNLALTYLALADRMRPRWLVWENVPGVLSSGSGRDFGAFLGALGQLGYGFAYRVLDAQYFGLAQRRKRVFVVGYLGDWRRAAAVLFERESLSGHPAPRREAGQSAPTIPSRRSAGGGLGTDFDCDGGLIAGTLGRSHGNVRADSWMTAHHHARKALPPRPLRKVWENGPDGCSPQGRGLAKQLARQLGKALSKLPSTRAPQASVMQVRRLTPRECERLMGFPDDYTLILYRGKPAADGPRYKALGNSMAVPVVRWIGRRIAAADALDLEQAA